MIEKRGRCAEMTDSWLLVVRERLAIWHLSHHRNYGSQFQPARTKMFDATGCADLVGNALDKRVALDTHMSFPREAFSSMERMLELLFR